MATNNERKEKKIGSNTQSGSGTPTLVRTGGYNPTVQFVEIPKEYQVSPWGVLSRYWDQLTGNTTVKVPANPQLIQGPTSTTRQASAIQLGSNPAMLGATAIGALGTGLWFGTNPQILRDLNQSGRDVSNYVQDKYGRISGYFYPTDVAGTVPTDSVPQVTPPAQRDSVPVNPPATPPANPQSGQDNSNNSGRPSFRERLGDRIAGRSSGNTNPPNNDQNNSFIKRLIWETKTNNFAGFLSSKRISLASSWRVCQIHDGRTRFCTLGLGWHLACIS